MAQIRTETRDALAAQALNEIAFCQQKKQAKYPWWYKNEDLYYQKKVFLSSERANVNLNEMQSFVQTFLSKINTPFNWKYIKGEEADLEPAKIANAIKDKDSKLGNWNYKATLARTQLVLYGRYIFEYHADSIDKQYGSHLSNVDVYQFHIDPSCWGDDIEKAYFMGRGWIIKTRTQIEEGIKSGIYLRREGEELLSGDGDDSESKEDRDSKNRYITLTNGDKTLHSKDNYKFYEWNTTHGGKRYYLLISDNGKVLKACPLTDLFASGKYPFFTVAAYPDLTEFWTPSPADGVREVIMAKSVSINQMLDNGEAINRPMRAFNVDAIANPALLKYRKDGLMPVKWGFNVQDAIQDFPVVRLTESMQVYDKLSAILDTNSGVNAGTKGNSNEDKVGIYEGNQANAADRFALIQESEAHGQKRFAELYLEWVDEHLTNKFAVEMIGLNGVEYKEVTKKDLKRKKNFDIMVSTAGAEMTMEATEKRNKLTFIQNNKMNPVFNPKLLAEMEATIAGFNADEVKSLLDKDYGNMELMSECARDMQQIIAGKTVKPNQAANTAYAQKLLDFIRDNEENLNDEAIGSLMIYFEEIQPIIMRNMTRNINEILASEGQMSLNGQSLGEDVLGTNPQMPQPQQWPAGIPQAPQNLQSQGQQIEYT